MRRRASTAAGQTRGGRHAWTAETALPQLTPAPHAPAAGLARFTPAAGVRGAALDALHALARPGRACGGTCRALFAGAARRRARTTRTRV